jgi:hypothetical protein
MRVTVRVGMAALTGSVGLEARFAGVAVVPMGPGVGVSVTQLAVPVHVTLDELVNRR